MSGVVLVLADAADAGAASVAASVRSLLNPAAVPVEVWSVRPDSLRQAAWSHRVDAQGRVHTRLALPGRPPLDGRQIRAVFNRIPCRTLPAAPTSARESDGTDPAFLALVLGGLSACGVRMLPALRSQPWRAPALPVHDWAAPAQACGLRVAVPPAAGGAVYWDATVLVAGVHTTGILAGRHGRACQAVAQALGVRLLEFRFARLPGRADGGNAQEASQEATLVDVSPCPELTDLEDIDAVAQCLVNLPAQDAALADMDV